METTKAACSSLLSTATIRSQQRNRTSGKNSIRDTFRMSSFATLPGAALYDSSGEVEEKAISGLLDQALQ